MMYSASRPAKKAARFDGIGICNLKGTNAP
jgi:hypothetical protein